MTNYSDDDAIFVEQLRAENPELRDLGTTQLLMTIKITEEEIKANDEVFFKTLSPIWKALSVIGCALLFFVICRLFLVGTGPAPINSHSLLVNILTSAPAEAVWKFFWKGVGILIFISIVVFGPISCLVLVLALVFWFALFCIVF